jgi:uncharacterized membrane protein
MSRNKRKNEIQKANSQPIPAEAIKILNELPPEQRKTIMAAAVSVMHFEGPIPPAPMVREYEEILPGSCDRIIKLAEKEQDERHKANRKIVNWSIFRKVVGLFFGAAMVFALLFIIYQVAMAGHDWLAGTLGTVTVIGLPTIFVLFREPSDKKKE